MQQDTHSRNMQNGNMASEMKPEAMCFKATAMTYSKHRCAGHMLRAHVSAMYRHVLVLGSYFDLNSNNGSVGGRLHCEPQGYKLVQLLVTPANSRHHAKSAKMYA